jgi:hypothetical protein
MLPERRSRRTLNLSSEHQTVGAEGRKILKFQGENPKDGGGDYPRTC